MFKFFQKKEETKDVENFKTEIPSEQGELVRFEVHENYIDVIFQEENADKTEGKYISDLAVGALKKTGKYKGEKFIKYSVYEYAQDSMECISNGDTIFVIQKNEGDIGKEILGYALILPQINSPANGVIEYIATEQEEIKNDDLICRIHKNDLSKSENSPFNNIYIGKFDKYEIPKSIRDTDEITGKFIFPSKWLVNNGDKVNIGDEILEIESSRNSLSNRPYYFYKLKAKAAGIIQQLEIQNKVWGSLRQKEPFYVIYKDEDIKFKELYSNEIDIQTDDFDKSKVIKWNVVGGLKYPFNSTTENPVGGVISDSSEGKTLVFSFQNHFSKDFIVFNYFAKEYRLAVNDRIYFLFDDDELICFNIVEKGYKANLGWENMYETKIPITIQELESFKNKKLVKWKIELDSSKQQITGIADNEWYQGNNFHKVVCSLAQEYVEAVEKHIDDYKPLENKIQKEEHLSKNEECFVYLMIDTTNNFHKIGISNSPQYRERTLQSDKPTIELICSKKFPSRRIAETIEKALHSTFGEKRLRGEWFELGEDEIEEIKETLK